MIHELEREAEVCMHLELILKQNFQFYACILYTDELEKKKLANHCIELHLELNPELELEVERRVELELELGVELGVEFELGVELNLELNLNLKLNLALHLRSNPAGETLLLPIPRQGPGGLPSSP